MMKRIYQISAILLVLCLFRGYAIAYEEPRYSNQFLISIFFKTQELRDNAISEIKKIDMEIAKNNETIQKSEKIIALAQQRSDAKAKQAELVARDALMKAQEAKRTNEEIKRNWELRKIRADKAYATVRNMLSQDDSKRQIKGFLTNYTGNVWVTKPNGEKISLDNSFLEPGDKVWTGNGTAEIQMLDGRANAKLGPYSEFVIEKDTPQEQIAKLLKGKVYMAVDKLDDYVKKFNEDIQKFKEDMTISELRKRQIDEYLKRKFEIHTPTAILGVRGTKFISEIKDDNTVEVEVLEGIVDVSILEKNKTLPIEAGNKATISLDGDIKVEKKEQIEKWWER